MNKHIKDCGIFIERDYSVVIYINSTLSLEKYEKIYSIVKSISEGLSIYKTKSSGICPFDNEIKISVLKNVDIHGLFWEIYSKLSKEKSISLVKTQMKVPTRKQPKKEKESN